MVDIAQIIGAYGFPIAVTIFVLVRLEGSMRKVEEALSAMREAIIKMELLHAQVLNSRTY